MEQYLTNEEREALYMHTEDASEIFNSSHIDTSSPKWWLTIGGVGFAAYDNVNIWQRFWLRFMGWSVTPYGDH